MIEYFTYEYGRSILNIMKYFNIGCLIVIVLMLAATTTKKKKEDIFLNQKVICISLLVIVAVAAILRLYRLSTLPVDIASDEASAYFDALCLANYGTNRWGEINAVYFNTWEVAGQSPAMATLASVFIRIFGNSLFVFRLSQAVPAIMTVLLAFFIGKKLADSLTGLIAAAILAISPWHIMMSRWALDCNLSAFAVTLAVCALAYSFDENGNMNNIFYLFCIFTGLSLYTYATTNIMMFVFVVMAYLYLLLKRKINFKIFIPANIILFIIALPMMYFFAVNYLDFPAFESSFLTIPYLKGFRSDDVSGDIISNIITHLSHLYQPTDRVVYYPQFSIMYVFSIPLIAYGIIRAIKRNSNMAIVLFWLAGSLVQLGMVNNSGSWGVVNLAAVLPYFIAYALTDIISKVKISRFVVPVAYSIALVMFIYTYIAVLPEETGIKIGAGTKDAIAFAQQLEVDKIYFSGYNGTGDAFIYAALNNQDSPEEYKKKLVRNPDAEHGKEIVQYDNLVFYQDIYNIQEDDVAVILFNYIDNVQYFIDMGYNIRTFRSFSVAYKG